MAEADVGPKKIYLKLQNTELDELVAKRRFVVEKTRRKMANLRRQVDEQRSKDVHDLQNSSVDQGSYTDLYGGTEPPVNEELKQRLSPIKSRQYGNDLNGTPIVTLDQKPSSPPNNLWSSTPKLSYESSLQQPVTGNYQPQVPNSFQSGYVASQPGYGALLVPLIPEGMQYRSPVLTTRSNTTIQDQNTKMNSSKDESCQTPTETKTAIVQSERILVPDFEESMPKLLSELTSAKDLNRELAEKLEEAECEIESMKLMQELAEATVAAEIAAKGAAIADEIYTAQKERDEAVMGRLRLANEERDEALARCRQGEVDSSDSGTDVNSNEEEFYPGNSTVYDLLGMLKHAESSKEVDRYGSSIIDKISNTKDRKKHITLEEMRVIIQERDVAMAKCKKLEKQVIENYRTHEGTSSKNKDLQKLEVQLQSTKQERDIAITKARKLEEELQNLRMYYSLHKSLSQEANLRDKFNNTLGNIEEQVKARDEVLVKAQKDKNHLASQLKISMDERNQVAGELQQSAMMQQELQEKCDKLERLVVVLRKKLAEGNVKTIN